MRRLDVVRLQDRRYFCAEGLSETKVVRAVVHEVSRNLPRCQLFSENWADSYLNAGESLRLPHYKKLREIPVEEAMTARSPAEDPNSEANEAPAFGIS